LRVVYMGTPEFAVPPLEHLIINHHEVVAAYTRPDKPAGRGRSLLPTPVKKAALCWQVPVVQTADLRAAATVTQLADLQPDVIVVAAYGQILPRAVLDLPRYGCVNIHPSLLPKYRGASPVASAILAGDEFTGVSIMLLDEGMDTGPVLAQAAVSVSRKDNTGSLTDRLAQVAARLLPEVLVRWPRGEIKPQPQPETGASYCGTISKQDGEIDWGLSAEEIWRRVRAFNPWPGSYTVWAGKQLKVTEAVPLPAVTAAPGGVIALPEGDNTFGIGTGEGTLGVVRVQLEGKRVMSSAEFLRGHRDFIGAVLPG